MTEKKADMNILAVGCHPDDVEIACAGTLCRYAREGASVYVCHVAKGDLGHKQIAPAQLTEIRKREAIAAGRVLGVKQVFTLGVPDLYVSRFNEEAVRELTNLIRLTRPDLIITHAENDYMRDHRETSHLVFNASFAASIDHYETAAAPFEKIPALYYMDTLAGTNFVPEIYIDISADIETKLEALRCHDSQLRWMREHDGLDFAEFVRTCSRVRGYQSGVAYAEGYIQCKVYPRMAAKTCF